MQVRSRTSACVHELLTWMVVNLECDDAENATVFHIMDVKLRNVEFATSMDHKIKIHVTNRCFSSKLKQIHGSLPNRGRWLQPYTDPATNRSIDGAKTLCMCVCACVCSFAAYWNHHTVDKLTWNKWHRHKQMLEEELNWIRRAKKTSSQCLMPDASEQISRNFLLRLMENFMSRINGQSKWLLTQRRVRVRDREMWCGQIDLGICVKPRH